MNTLLVVFFLVNMSIFSSLEPINFRSATSAFLVPDGANLFLQNKIQNCTGKVAINSSSVSGQVIEFNGGTLHVNNNNPLTIVGTYHTGVTNRIVLAGDQAFQGNASIALQDIRVQGKNNRISGDLVLMNDIVLEDSNASLTCAIVRSLSQDIQLNGGTLFLEENLRFVDGKKIIGNGLMLCNKRKLILGAEEMTWNGSIYFDNGNDINLNAPLHLSQTWTFSGATNSLIGNGNILYLENHGKLVIERGASLILKNIIIKNLSADKIKCLDDSANIIFQDVTLVQNDLFSFNKGSFDVFGYLDLTGSQTFVLQPTNECTIKSASILAVEPHMTLSVDFVTTRTDMLVFENDTSILSLRNSTLHVTTTGLLLKGGSVNIEGSASVYSELKLDELMISSLPIGIQIGDLSASKDCVIEIQSSAQLNIDNGWLIYKNVRPSSWHLYSDLSSLKIAPLGVLDLQQPISYTQGLVKIAQSATLYQRGPNYLDGSTQFFVS